MKGKKLKILIVVTEFPSVSETFILNQIADLIDKGHELTVFSYNEPSEKIIHQLFIDYQLHKHLFTHFKNRKSSFYKIIGAFSFLLNNINDIDYKNIFQFFNLYHWKRNILKAKIYYDFPLFILKKKYDIIHSHFGFNGVKISRASKLGISIANKKILTFHGSDLTPSKIQEYKIIYEDIFKVFDAITVNSPYAEGLVRLINPSFKKLYVLPVGFNVDYININGVKVKNENFFDIVFCGRLIHLKGPDIAIKIIKKLIEIGYENVRLHLIGTGELLTEIKTSLDFYNLHNNVILHGSLAQREVYSIMASSDVFIYTGRVEENTGRAETQGLVIQEAQFLKLPVIVTNVGGVKYGMVENKSGFLLDPEDISTFVDKLLELINQPKKRTEMGIYGHEFVKEKFSSKLLGIQLLKIYES